MFALSAEKRRELLDHYMAYEPTMKVNGYTYHVHAFVLPDVLLFVALNSRMQWIEGAASIPRDVYDSINSGLAMAWITMTAYDDLEASVKDGTTRLDLNAFSTMCEAVGTN